MTNRILLLGTLFLGSVLLFVDGTGVAGTPQVGPTPTPTESPSPTPSATSSPHYDADSSTRVTIHYRPTRHLFSGAVYSNRVRCERRRQVVLRKQRSGKDRVLGETFTNHDGRWSFKGFVNPRGRYYAEARVKQWSTPDGDVRRCVWDRSRILEL